MAATDNEYDVKAVRGHRYNTARNNREEVLIEWTDFGENSWEPLTNLSDASLELAKKYKEKMDNLPPPSNAYRHQARQLLVNTFQRVACTAIDVIFLMCKFNFTRSFYYVSVIDHQRTNNGDGAGQFDLIPKRVKVFIKSNRQKTIVEVTDATLLGELDDIPELNLKVGTTTKQSVVTPKMSFIDLTADSSDDEEEKEEEKECLCCYGDYPVSALKQCSAGKDHNVCRECIQRYVSEQLDGNGSTVFKCIVSADCSCEYSLAFLNEVLSPTLNKRANEMVALEEIKKAGGDDVWSCPKCAYMGFVEGKPTWIICPGCEVMYCTSCNASHTGFTCEEFRRQQTIGKDPKHLAAEAMSKACKRCCPHCGQDYLKSDGCNKIRCKCGNLSCYLCGQKIQNYSHFCNKRGCACGKCQLWTSTEAMENIDRAKRQEAGRKVLLEQGITDEEEIAAILSSLDEDAAVHRGGAGNQRAAAAAAAPQNQNVRMDAPAVGGLNEHLRRLNDLLGLNIPPIQGFAFGAATPPRRPVPAPQVAEAGNPPRFAFGAAAPNPRDVVPNPPVAAARGNPPQQGFAFGAAEPAPPQRAAPAPQVAEAGNPPRFAFGANTPVAAAMPNPPQQGFAFGAAEPAPPQRAAPAPQVAEAGNPPRFAFGANPPVAAAMPNPPQQGFAFGAAEPAPPQRAAPAPQVAEAGNPPRFAFGAAAPNRRIVRPNPPVAAARPNHQQYFQQLNFNGVQVQVQHNLQRPVQMVQVQHNQQQQDVNQLAENFGEMGFGRRGANGAPGRRHGAGEGNIAHDERLLPLFNRLLSSARVHAMEGREREMNNDLARARALAERPDARRNHGIAMHYYEAHARLTRRRLQLQQG
eukprot:scaffold1366_cov155-Skeletonema_menzelii.AAC.26